MPRPASFQRDQILRRAIGVFWRRGYRGSSVKELVAATHLQPGSLYAAFDNKRSLFQAAVECYFQDLLALQRRMLRGQGTPLERLDRFFRHLCRECEQDEEGRGCLLVNALLDAPDDAELTDRLRQMFSEFEREFVLVLEAAREAGELPLDSDPRAGARFLITGMYGLRVCQKVGAVDGHARAFAERLIEALR